jgi:uncharacterized protein (DUF433 family)
MHAFDAQPPPLRTDDHGVIRIGVTRISLESVVTAFDRGATAEEIVESFPALNLAQVYGTLAYVLTHRASVDHYMSQQKQRFEQLREEAERRFPADGLRDRLLARRRSAQS